MALKVLQDIPWLGGRVHEFSCDLTLDKAKASGDGEVLGDQGHSARQSTQRSRPSGQTAGGCAKTLRPFSSFLPFLKATLVVSAYCVPGAAPDPDLT